MADPEPQSTVIPTLGVAEATSVFERGLERWAPFAQAEIDRRVKDIMRREDAVINDTDTPSVDFWRGFGLRGQGAPDSWVDLKQDLIDPQRIDHARRIRGELSELHNVVAGDGIDDYVGMKDQARFQSIFLAVMFGANGKEPWKYTQARGGQMVEAYDKMPLWKKLRFAGMDAEADALKTLGDTIETLEEDAEANKEALEAANAERDELVTALKNSDGIKDARTEFLKFVGSIQSLHSHGKLTDQRLIYSQEAHVAPLAQDIFDDYVTAHKDKPFHLALFNRVLTNFTGGFGLKDMVSDPSDLPSIPGTDNFAVLYQRAFEESGASDTEAFEESFLDSALGRLGFAPFGTEMRRTEYDNAVRGAFDAVRKKREEDAGADIEFLAAVFAMSLQKSINAIEEMPGAEPQYLTTNMRMAQIQIDPRVAKLEIQVEGKTVSGEDLFALYKRYNNNFLKIDGNPRALHDHSPLTLRAANGDIYIAAVDEGTGAFTVQKVDPATFALAASGTAMDRPQRIELLKEIQQQDPAFALAHQPTGFFYFAYGKSFMDYGERVQADAVSYSALETRVGKAEAELAANKDAYVRRVMGDNFIEASAPKDEPPKSDTATTFEVSAAGTEEGPQDGPVVPNETLPEPTRRS